MCKIAIIPKIESGSEELAQELLIALTGPMTERDSDGYGYIALGDAGIFGERWLNVDQAWCERESTPKELNQFASILESSEVTHSEFGTRTKRIYSIAAHARMATCGIALENVHPFVNESESIGLIHNGVIQNAHEFKLRLSTCDSESILHAYEKHDVAESFKKIQVAVKELQGWYAVALYSKNSKGAWSLDIFKEERANLHCAYVDGIGAIFVTNPDHLRDACDALKLRITGMTAVVPNFAIRLDGLTGDTVHELRIKPAVPATLAGAKVSNYSWMDADLDAPSYRDDYTGQTTNDDGPLDCVDAMNLNDPFHYKRGA